MKKRILALLLGGVMVLGLAACSSSGSQSPSPSASAPAASAPAESTPAEPASAVKVGGIMLHDENSGYDMAHIEGLTTACKNLGLDLDTQLIIKYNVPEDENCYDAAVDLAEQGCTIIFSDSYGHQSYMQQAASEFEDVIFVSCTGDNAAASGLANLKNIFPYTYESRYVSGVVAGMKLKELLDAGTVTDPYVGYVGADFLAEGRRAGKFHRRGQLTAARILTGLRAQAADEADAHALHYRRKECRGKPGELPRPRRSRGQLVRQAQHRHEYRRRCRKAQADGEFRVRLFEQQRHERRADPRRDRFCRQLHLRT